MFQIERSVNEQTKTEPKKVRLLVDVDGDLELQAYNGKQWIMVAWIDATDNELNTATCSKGSLPEWVGKEKCEEYEDFYQIRVNR